MEPDALPSHLQERIAGRKVLVTGGAGFIGGHVVRVLLDRGADVRVIDLRPSDALDRRAQFLEGSVFDQRLLRAGLDGVQWVFHLAANPNLWTAAADGFLQANVETVRTVITAAAAAGVDRIVHTSSEAILVGRGHRPGAPVDEDSQPAEAALFGPYCRSKLAGERVALAAAARGAPVVVVNPTMPIGPDDDRLTPPTQMLRGFLNGEHPAYLDFAMNLVDVRDAARGHVLAAEHGRIGERYILGGENLSMTDLLARLRSLTDLSMPRRRVPSILALAVGAVSEAIATHITRKPPQATVTGVRLARAGLVVESAKAARELGYAAGPIDVALADSVAWLAERGLLRREPRLAGPGPGGQGIAA